MVLSLKIEMLHFIVSDIVATRRVVIEVATERYVWVRCYGIPLDAWGVCFFKFIGNFFLDCTCQWISIL